MGEGEERDPKKKGNRGRLPSDHPKKKKKKKKKKEKKRGLERRGGGKKSISNETQLLHVSSGVKYGKVTGQERNKRSAGRVKRIPEGLGPAWSIQGEPRNERENVGDSEGGDSHT